MQSKARVGVGYLLGPRFGLVRATVEDQQDLVLFGETPSCSASASRQETTSSSSLRAGTTTQTFSAGRGGGRGDVRASGQGGSLLDELTALLVVLVGVVG